MTNDPYEPTPAQRETGMMTRNARACGVCGSGADRYHWGYQCQADPNHHGDPTMGLFTDKIMEVVRQEAARRMMSLSKVTTTER